MEKSVDNVEKLRFSTAISVFRISAAVGLSCIPECIHKGYPAVFSCYVAGILTGDFFVILVKKLAFSQSLPFSAAGAAGFSKNFC